MIDTDKLPAECAGDFPCNDSGNASRLLTVFGDDLRFAPGIGWLRWQDGRWVVGSDGPFYEAERCAQAIVLRGEKMKSEAGAAVARWGHTCGNAGRIAACVEVASHRPSVRIDAAQLDADPLLFNCANGTVDLRTGVMREHRREDLCTKQSPIAYDPHATAPRFVQFLRECMAGDDELVAYLLRFLGYCLTADTREHCFGLWHGPSGRNGKGTLLNVMSNVMGDYATTLAPGLLLASKHQEHSTGLLDLRGVRFASSNEVPEGQRFNEALVKQLTGGDRIKARAMRQDHVEFSPTHKLVLACNARPLVREHGPAFWSRVAEVPWLVSFRGREDRGLAAQLEAEAPGVLALLVAGCRAWIAQGLCPPTRMVEAGAEYRASQDVIGAFLAECCDQGPNALAEKSALYRAYKFWADQSGEYCHGKHAFNRQLAERGWQLVKPKCAGESWQGLRLLPGHGGIAVAG